MTLNIGVLASHGGSNMQAIIDGIEAGTLDAEIVMVISNNSGSGALERARKHRLPHQHLSGVQFPRADALDTAICSALQEAGVEVVVLAGYMKKIGPRTLGTFTGRILNIHPALLPRHGGQGMYGIHPHEAVLAAGDTESGASVHVVDANYDEGPVLKQRRVPVRPDDTPETLQKRVLEQEHVIYAGVLGEIIAGTIRLPGGGA